MKNDKDVHLKLRNLRISRGLTVNKLADEMGEDHQKVGRVERGARNITIDYLLKVSKALQTPVESILSEENRVKKVEENDSILKKLIHFFDEKDSFTIERGQKADLVAKIYKLAISFPESYRHQFLDSIFDIFNIESMPKEYPK